MRPIQLRADTKSSFTVSDPVLCVGEMGLELDSYMFKWGDGNTPWNDLPYFGQHHWIFPQGYTVPSGKPVYHTLPTGAFIESALATFPNSDPGTTPNNVWRFGFNAGMVLSAPVNSYEMESYWYSVALDVYSCEFHLVYRGENPLGDIFRHYTAFFSIDDDRVLDCGHTADSFYVHDCDGYQTFSVNNGQLVFGESQVSIDYISSPGLIQLGFGSDTQINANTFVYAVNCASFYSYATAGNYFFAPIVLGGLTLQSNGAVGLALLNPASATIANRSLFWDSVLERARIKDESGAYLTLNTGITLIKDTDGTLAANSDNNVATQKAVKTYVDLAVSDLGVAGSDTQIQYNNAGEFGASSSFIWDNAALRFTNGISHTRSLSRTLPTTVNDVVQIGTFTDTTGAVGMQFYITVAVSSGGISITKSYSISSNYGLTGTTWYKVDALTSSGPYGSDDFELDYQNNGSDTAFRLRRTGGSTAGTAHVSITTISNGSTFTPSTSTSSVSAPTISVGSITISSLPTATTRVLITTGRTDGTALSLQAVASQSADVMKLLNSGGTTVTAFDSTLRLTSTALNHYYNPALTDNDHGALYLQPTINGASKTFQVIYGVPSWTDVTGSALSFFRGYIVSTGTSNSGTLLKGAELSLGVAANQTVGTVYGIHFTPVANTGTVTTAVGYYINNAVESSGGSVGTYYGVYAEDLTAATTNYVWCSNRGLVKFGDTVRIEMAVNTNQALVIKGAASQSANYISVINSSDAAVFTLNSSGQVTVGTWMATLVGIAYGGTGADTAAGARLNLLPSIVGNATKVLTVNAGATDVEWADAGGPTSDPITDSTPTTLTGYLKGNGADIDAVASIPNTDITGLGTASVLDSDTDGTLAANSDTKIATQKAVKTYVDTIAAGLKWKTSVRVATTAAGTLASSFENGDTVDGVTLATGDRILIKDQSDAKENGIYIVAASGAPTRATDADTGTELVSAAVFVSEGAANADKAFVCTNDSITLGVTNIAFVTFNSAIGALLASNNLSDLTNAATARTNLGLGTLATQNGTFSGTSSGTNTGDQTITLSGDVTGSGTGGITATLASTAVVAGSYGSASQVGTFTVDAKGRLTAAANTAIAIAAGAVSGLATVATSGSASDLGTGTLANARLDATLAAFAALTISANTLTIGTGTDTFSQTSFAANTFPARASTGDLVAKTITDFGLSLVDDASASVARQTLGVDVFDIGFSQATAADGTTYLSAKASFAFTISQIRGLKTTSGTCTLAIKINGTSVTGLSSLSVTSTTQDAPATAANSVAVGDEITCVISSSSSPVDLRFTLKCTR